MGVRFCEAYSSLTSYKIQENGRIYWDGLEGFLRNHYYNYIYDFNALKNDTITRSETNGVKITDQQFNGCLGLMQANLSDFTSPSLELPIYATNLTQLQVMYQLTFSIASLERNSIPQEARIFQNPFDIITNLIILFAPIIVAIILILDHITCKKKKKLITKQTTKIKMNKKYLASLILNSLSVFKFYLRQFIISRTRINQRSKVSNILILTSVVLSFFVVTIYISSISTDLQVKVKPDFIDSYKKVIDNNLTVFALTTESDQQHLSKAPNDSDKNQIYRNNMYKATFNFNSLRNQSFYDALSSRNSVFFTSYPPYFYRSFCTFRQPYKLKDYMIAIFEQEGLITKGLAAGIGFKSTKLAMRLKRTFENDLIQPVYSILWPPYYRENFVDPDNRNSYDECMKCDKTMIYDELYLFKSIKLINIEPQLKMCVVLIIVSFFLFAMESFKEYRNKKPLRHNEMKSKNKTIKTDRVVGYIRIYSPTTYKFFLTTK